MFLSIWIEFFCFYTYITCVTHNKCWNAVNFKYVLYLFWPFKMRFRVLNSALLRYLLLYFAHPWKYFYARPLSFAAYTHKCLRWPLRRVLSNRGGGKKKKIKNGKPKWTPRFRTARRFRVWARIICICIIIIWRALYTAIHNKNGLTCRKRKQSGVCILLIYGERRYYLGKKRRD